MLGPRNASRPLSRLLGSGHEAEARLVSSPDPTHKWESPNPICGWGLGTRLRLDPEEVGHDLRSRDSTR